MNFVIKNVLVTPELLADVSFMSKTIDRSFVEQVYVDDNIINTSAIVIFEKTGGTVAHLLVACGAILTEDNPCLHFTNGQGMTVKALIKSINDQHKPNNVFNLH